jgi:protocatechuate 3,4-dioxygenase beta subunit
MSQSTLYARRELLTRAFHTGASGLLISTFGIACARASGALPAASASAANSAQAGAAAARTAAQCSATAANIEGPFFKPGAPMRTELASAQDRGERLVVRGRVMNMQCTPVAGARIEIWQADAAGGYDNNGMHFRATQVADAAGNWSINSVVPGRYLNGRKFRPAHIHAKVHVPGQPALTTQLYFAGDPENQDDPFIVPSLIMQHELVHGIRRAEFNFVVG